MGKRVLPAPPVASTRAIEAITGSGLFRLFGQQSAERILALGSERRLAAGDALFLEGEPGDCAFVLMEGALEVFVDIGADRVCVALLEPFKLVGEIAVFADQPRIATVMARDPCLVLCLGRDDLLALLAADPAAGQAIIADLGRRLAAVNRPLAFLATASQLLRNEQVDGEALAGMAADVGHLGPFADSFAAMVREIHAKQERRQDMEMARRIQTSVLPAPLPLPPATLTLRGLIRPMKEVGGDLYDYFMVDDRHVAIAIADVSGKGVPAALFMMRFQTVVRALASLEPHQVMSRANALMAEHNDECMFVTAFFALLDLVDGGLSFVNAGHNPAFLLPAGGVCSELTAQGAAIGLVEQLDYRPQSAVLRPGDRLFLYTDGISEAVAADGAMFGEDRLRDLLLARRHLPAGALNDAVLAAVDDFADGREQSDDITCLTVDFRPAG